jgi:hypothetical protein
VGEKTPTQLGPLESLSQSQLSKLVNTVGKYVRFEIFTVVTMNILHDMKTSGPVEVTHSQLDKRILSEGL